MIKCESIIVVDGEYFTDKVLQLSTYLLSCWEKVLTGLDFFKGFLNSGSFKGTDSVFEAKEYDSH